MEGIHVVDYSAHTAEAINAEMRAMIWADRIRVRFLSSGQSEVWLHDEEARALFAVWRARRRERR